MKVTKIETNYSRNMFLKMSEIKPGKYKENIENKVINIYPEIEYQQFIGFGGAITQAAGIVYQQLSKEKQEEFLNEYFKTCKYNLCRVPIGSCDFSPEMYSYSYKKDLSDFSIEKDHKYIMPLLKDALRINPELKLLASPWSPPAFMKNNKMLTLGGRLNEKYYELYALYLAKYIKEYEKEGINIQYTTIQNEPNATQIWESCLFNKEEEMRFLNAFLKPVFENENIKTKILVYDHNKEKLFSRAEYMLNNSNIDGIAYHWYTGDHFESVKLCSELYPNKLLIHTEGCVGFSNFNKEDEIKNAEIYAHDIIGDLSSGCNGYIDWNILLDSRGGPNHKKNYCNSPVMVTKEENDYYKNLSYYYIAQFAKVILPNSRKIAVSKYIDKIELVAFKNENEDIGIVLLNRNDTNYEYNLCLDDIMIHDNLDKHAMVSYLIQK